MIEPTGRGLSPTFLFINPILARNHRRTNKNTKLLLARVISILYNGRV